MCSLGMEVKDERLRERKRLLMTYCTVYRNRFMRRNVSSGKFSFLTSMGTAKEHSKQKTKAR